jgi:hypothetical protein
MNTGQAGHWPAALTNLASQRLFLNPQEGLLEAKKLRDTLN